MSDVLKGLVPVLAAAALISGFATSSASAAHVVVHQRAHYVTPVEQQPEQQSSAHNSGLPAACYRSRLVEPVVGAGLEWENLVTCY
ncbi:MULTISPECIES: hypothetical protein [unclassified Beijerinckia]|uniref:hypothetical protein n=1 Tax=unclassified Beijerinckia TaxID=2638183 RepID=UPI00089C1EA0|nr:MULTISPECIES: hypothetical protein [unclassified Beijerinckia]MDH7794472.1 hypothetical protein [Beijerinckia sp. GAS462]SEB63469.1 hypothetical protein SAMN05443249_0744 [Beijerinckia sp. 28-YEA-48]